MSNESKGAMPMAEADSVIVATTDPEREIDQELVDELLAQAGEQNLELLGEGGLLQQLAKQVLETALDAEFTSHLGYERGDASGRGSGNSRNSTSPKKVHTDIGTVDLDFPCDRNSSFEPEIVPKKVTRLQGFNDRIITLYARGMTVRDIQAQMAEMHDVEVSPDLISQGTAAVLDEAGRGRTARSSGSLPLSISTPSPARSAPTVWSPASRPIWHPGSIPRGPRTSW